MGHAPACYRPIKLKEKSKDPAFNIMADPEKIEFANELRIHNIDIEPLSRCAGGCLYCYASSDRGIDYLIPKERLFEVIEDASNLGVRIMQWCGGDPILHPDWYELASFTAEKGMVSSLVTSGLVSKQVAKQICSLGEGVNIVGMNLATVDQTLYNKVHKDPKTLQMRIQGFHNLLEAGYPAEQILALVTTTRPALQGIQQTLDFLCDEIGCAVCLVHFKTCGSGDGNESWEPPLSEIKKAIEYRAKKCGDHWLRIGSSEGGRLYCRANIAILYDGAVTPCTMFRNEDFTFGNIHNSRLTSIFEQHRDALLWNAPIKGFCNEECPNSDICFGCRASAYHYLGDAFASDPKCYLNPEARETYFG